MGCPGVLNRLDSRMPWGTSSVLRLRRTRVSSLRVDMGNLGPPRLPPRSSKNDMHCQWEFRIEE